MPNKDKNIPKRRFKEFENADAWELRKLGDTVIEIIAGGDIDKNKVVEFGKYPIYANSHSGDGIVGYYDDFYRVNGPAVTVTGRGEVGFAKARETDFTPVVRLLAIRSKHNHCFLENAINLHGVTVESTGVPQLTVPQLSAYRIYFPYDIQEENQIGTFFSTLDQQITLHQRKLDKLKSVKQAYLSEIFPAEGERVPKRRFPGFTDAWELRKFKDILKTHSFRSYLAGVSENGEYEVIQQGDKPIVGYSDGEPFTDYKDVTLFGDHTVSLYKPKSPFFVATDGVKILSADNFEGNYLYTTLERYKPEPQGYKRHFTILKNQDVWFTENMEEQQKIGSFFKQLDDTIALHQHKLDLLKEQKKGFLQKMFPKNGAKVPELRFAGFADDWEQRKLGDLAEIKDSARIPNIKWQKEGVPYLRSSDLSSEHIKDGLFLSLADYMKYDKITGSPKKGDLIFASGGDIGLAIYKHDSLPIYVQGGSILYVKTSKCENLDGLFLKYSFASPKVKKYIRNASTGTSLKHFVLKPANALPISYPDLIEQEKIGSLLMQMDRTITLHQRKLDLLKEQKKGFLQKMFV